MGYCHAHMGFMKMPAGIFISVGYLFVLEKGHSLEHETFFTYIVHIHLYTYGPYLYNHTLGM
jgi:hypothetical protein